MLRQLSVRILLTLLALFFSSLCYIYGSLSPVEDAVYTGMRPLNASDYNVNLSFIEQYREGHVLVKNLYASEPHEPFLIRPVYFLLSAPFSVTKLSNPVAFHVIRLIVGGALLLCLFHWISVYVSDRKEVTFIFLLLAFTSGVGFFVKAWIKHPLDLTVPESILFLSLGEPPHFLSSLFLLFFGLTNLYLAVTRWPRALIFYFVSLLLLWFEHPFEAVVLAAVGLFNLWLLPSNRMRIAAIIGLITVSAPAFFYYSHLRKMPVFAAWAEQNVLKTPSPYLLVLGFLPLVFFAVRGILVLRKTPHQQTLLKFLLIWIAVQTVMCYVPVPFQRRFIAGLQFPLAILAGVGLTKIRLWPVTTLILFVSTFSNVFVMWQQIQDIKKGEMPFYAPSFYFQAFDWLRTQPKGQVVLSGYITGNFIPAYTGLTVYAGHSIQTPNVVQKRQQLVRFFHHPDRTFLWTNKIDLVFYGLEEQRMNGKEVRSMLPLVYESKNIEIFASKPPSKSP